MTNTQKTGTAAVGLMAVLSLLLASQSLPAIQFLFGELKLFASLPLFGPVVVSAAVGAIAPAWLPYLVPPRWERHATKRVTRLLGFLMAFAMVFWRYPNAVGAQYGLFAGSMAYMAYTMLSGFVYRLIPQVEPPSMKPDDPS